MAGVTEVQPGSYTVMDAQYRQIGSSESNAEFATYLPAITLLTTVISANKQSHVTLDAGLEALYYDATPPIVISHPGLAYEWGGFGDEHGKLVKTVEACNLPAYLDLVELIVPHCDPSINLFDRFYIVENDKVIDVWEIDMRGKSQ